LDKTPRKIVDLTEGSSFTVEGIVASTPLIREVTTSKGETVLLATFDVADETGEIPVTLWRKHAEFARQLALGTRIRMENAYAKRGFSNPLELTSRSATTIEIVAEPEAEQTENKIE
jgi:ssDNA-binding replication factor A large subunit